MKRIHQKISHFTHPHVVTNTFAVCFLWNMKVKRSDRYVRNSFHTDHTFRIPKTQRIRFQFWFVSHTKQITWCTIYIL